MPVSPSALQSGTSRRNGTLSRGPVSEAGKTASSQNALRHGLRGGGISVRSEESGWYAGLLATHLELYVPANEAEESLVEQLCLVELKLHRLDVLELAALEPPPGEDVERKSPRLPALATLTRYRHRIVKERWELEHRLTQLQHRRKTLGPDAAGARQELRQEARARALGAMAMMGVLGSGLLGGDDAGGTNGPEPAETNQQKSTNGPDAADTNRQKSTNGPEAANRQKNTDGAGAGGVPPNRRQRRMMEKRARQRAARAAVPKAA